MDELVVRMIAKDFQTLDIDEDDGFVQLVYALHKNYPLPSRNTFANVLIRNMYNDVKSTLMKN